MLPRTAAILVAPKRGARVHGRVWVRERVKRASEKEHSERKSEAETDTIEKGGRSSGSYQNPYV